MKEPGTATEKSMYRVSNRNADKGAIYMNIIPIFLTGDVITVGKIPKMDKESYFSIKEKRFYSHAFRYEREIDLVYSITLEPRKFPTIGESDTVVVKEGLFLVSMAIKQRLLTWFSGKREILKDNRSIVFRGKQEEGLIKKYTKQYGIKYVEGIDITSRFEIDVRVFKGPDGQPFLGLILDASTSCISNSSISSLILNGFDPTGKYVCKYSDPIKKHLSPKRELLGKVAKVSGDKVYLIDSELKSIVSASEVFLEARQETLEELIKHFYPANWQDILSEKNRSRKQITSAIGKLEKIQEIAANLSKKSMYLGETLKVSFGDPIQNRRKIFPSIIQTSRPSFLVGPQGRNPADWPDIAIKKFGPYMSMQHDRNKPLIGVLCERQLRGRVDEFLESLRAGIPGASFGKRNNPYQSGMLNKFRLSEINYSVEEVSGNNASAYQDAGEKLINRLPTLPDLVIVQIREHHRELFGSANPYFKTKALFMSSGIPTQCICFENIDKQLTELAYTLNQISLAIYAKLDGVPWVLSTRRQATHELIMGLGSVEVANSRTKKGKRYVGITTVFRGDGKYQVWDSSREAEFEDYPAALLSSLERIILFAKEDNNWREGEEIRLVFHVYKRLKNCEIEAVKSLVSALTKDRFSVSYAFLDISWHHPYFIFDTSQYGVEYWDFKARSKSRKGTGVPMRGLCYQLDDSRGLIQLTGAKELKTDEQGTPQPLMVEVHSSSDFLDLPYLLRQVYNFSFMSWRSYFPSSEPITISYSRMIARLLGNLREVEGWNSQVMTGPLRTRKWFL